MPRLSETDEKLSDCLLQIHNKTNVQSVVTLRPLFCLPVPFWIAPVNVPGSSIRDHRYTLFGFEAEDRRKLYHIIMRKYDASL